MKTLSAAGALAPLRTIKRKYVAWLTSQITAEQDRRRLLERKLVPATLGQEAILAEEAQIENGVGTPENIMVGAHSFVRGRLIAFPPNGQISIGEWCYVGHRTELWSMNSISIGNRVLIAHNVSIVDHTAHSRDPKERHAHFRHILDKGHPTNPADLPGIYSTPIVVEDDVWISFGVTVLRGVRIGAGSIIAAGSIVSSDVPPGVIYRCEVNPIITPLKRDK